MLANLAHSQNRCTSDNARSSHRSRTALYLSFEMKQNVSNYHTKRRVFFCLDRFYHLRIQVYIFFFRFWLSLDSLFSTWILDGLTKAFRKCIVSTRYWNVWQKINIWIPAYILFQLNSFELHRLNFNWN